MDNAHNIRLATDEDGPEIGNLVWQGGFRVDGIDWTDIGPYWLVAENGAGIVGCIQVCPGKPIGRAEFLSVDEKLTHREQAVISKALVIQGCATLSLWGSQAASSMVSFKNKGFKRILKRRGARVMSSGNMFLKRLV